MNGSRFAEMQPVHARTTEIRSRLTATQMRVIVVKNASLHVQRDTHTNRTSPVAIFPFMETH